MPIIAITREMGSLGKDVARGLGEELGDGVGLGVGDGLGDAITGRGLEDGADGEGCLRCPG